MKTFEIPSMGGVLITQRNTEQNKFFPESKASLMFENIKELKFKIRNTKTKSKIYKNIKKRAFKIVEKNSYKLRAKYLINKIYD